MLIKVIIILLLIMFLTGQFTRSREVRIRRRQNITNLLLAAIAVIMLLSLVHAITH
jgi:ACR3 family arsenite efflux pump ArsB